MDVLGEGVLKSIVCRVTIDGDVPDDSPVEVLVEIIGTSCVRSDTSYGFRRSKWSMQVGSKMVNSYIAMIFTLTRMAGL